MGGSIVAMAAFWAAIRTEAGIGDVKFLRSMIPHHSGAVLMCSESSIADPEIHDLCNSIVYGQQKEIEQMKRIVERLDRR